MNNTAIKGKYKPIYPAKYIGNINTIIYRSLWERRFMLYCDKSDQIIRWSSEELHIPYLSPKDNQWHNYYPDFQIETIDDRMIVVEIKPFYQMTYDVNKAKWKYARKYCKRNDIEFIVLTEKELF